VNIRGHKLILFAMYVAYLAAMYQWFLVKPGDQHCSCQGFVESYPIFYFAVRIWFVWLVVVCMILCVLYICWIASVMYSAALSPVYAF
jgi:hypothetical protein